MSPGALSIWLIRLQVMFAKELRQLGRDRILLLFIIYAFTVDIYLAASGVSLQLNNAATVVQDMDQSPASRELSARFQSPYFAQQGQVGRDAAAQALLDDGKAMVVLSLPPAFGDGLARGVPTQVQMQIDTSNSVLGFLASSYAQQIVARFALENAAARSGLTGTELPTVNSETRVWFNPNQEDSWFMGISELLNIITVFAVLLPAAAMVREKEKGTVEQLIVSPLSPFQILFPKVLAMTLVIVAGTLLTLYGVLVPLFDVPVKGSAPAFIAMTALYVFTTAGFGLFAATIARNLAQAGMLTILILAPMLFLSGAWTPPEAMPPLLLWFMDLSPLHYFLDIAFGILLKGQTLAELWRSVLGMLLLGGTVFAFGLLRFRRQFDG